MKSFFIKSITAVSKDNRESTINFADGFNIIHGPSNTGKTLVLNTINYLFGSEKLDGLVDQEYVTMDIKYRNGEISLKRYLNTNKSKVYVSSTVSEVESGEYSTSSKSKNKLSDIFLRLIGINELPIKIIKNENFMTQTLTWRSFLHMFFLQESEIVRHDSILLPKVTTSKTAFYSSLLYLINGEDQEILEKEESPENIKLKNEAIRNYVNNKLYEIAKQESAISESVKYKSKSEVEAKLNDAIKKLKYENSSLSNLLEENKQLIKSNNSLTNKREENSISISNFRKLIEQYKIDENRLLMVVDSQSPVSKFSNKTVCPFCESSINDKNILIDLNSTLNELENLRLKTKDLNDTLKFLLETDSLLENTIENNQAKINSNAKHINQIISPSIKKLEEAIDEYNSYFNLIAEKEALYKISSNWRNDLSMYDDEQISENKYRPLDRLPNNFFLDMSKIVENILKSCSFPNLDSARFDKKSFDVFINGKPKSTQGKGYRSYLNSILSLSILTYIKENGVFSLPIFIVDTPLLGLDEMVKEINIESKEIFDMRTAFYEYLINEGNTRQLIVVDNNKDLPDIDLKRGDINSIEFTKSTKFGRYGFLNNIID